MPDALYLVREPTDASAVPGDAVRKLFKIEDKLAEESKKRRESVRRKLSAPIVEEFFAWCAEQAESVLEGAPLEAALTYATNQKVALRRFLDDGRL